MNPASCDIIIPAHNGLAMTRDCLDSIYTKTSVSFNMILIDNGSDRETGLFLDEFKSKYWGVTVIHNPANLGWVKGVNQGMRLSASPYLCIMNNDTIVRTAGWLEKLTDIGEACADIGLINPNFDAKGRPCTSRPFGSPVQGRPFTEVDFCRGYCILIKRSVMEKIGLLDEAYGLGYYDDDDYSVRAIRAGFRCVKANNVVVEHLRDSTFRTIVEEDERMTLHERNKMLFYSKWGRRLKLVFLLTKDVDRKNISELLLSLARRQHLIHLWNCGSVLGIEHTLIRERVFPKAFPIRFFRLPIYMNGRRKDTKRYDLIFTDDGGFDGPFAGRAHRMDGLDLERERDRIIDLVDSTARQSKTHA